jgi:hypothetical protein
VLPDMGQQKVPMMLFMPEYPAHNVYNLKHAHVFIYGYIDYEDETIRFLEQNQWRFAQQRWEESVVVRSTGTRVAVMYERDDGWLVLRDSLDYYSLATWDDIEPEPEDNGICEGPFCDHTKPMKRWRQNTAYDNPLSNYVTCCEDCFEEIEEYWAGQWADYYAMVM